MCLNLKEKKNHDIPQPRRWSPCRSPSSPSFLGQTSRSSRSRCHLDVEIGTGIFRYSYPGLRGYTYHAGNAHGYATHTLFIRHHSLSTPYPPCEQLLAAAVRGASRGRVVGSHSCPRLTRGCGPVAPLTTTASQCSHGRRGGARSSQSLPSLFAGLAHLVVTVPPAIHLTSSCS